MMRGKEKGGAKGGKTRKSELKHIADQREVIGERLSSAGREAYKLLRTNIVFSISDVSQCKIIGITGASKGEGASTTAINLAYSLAEAKKAVLLIEADMRSPLFGPLLEIDSTPGLSEVLAGVGRLDESVRHSVLSDGLSVLPAGNVPPNPCELLSSANMRRTLFVLSEGFDYIVVDLPPVTEVSDGLAISNLLSGVVLVVRPDHCDRRDLDEAIKRLEFLKVKILGFVVNRKKQ